MTEYRHWHTKASCFFFFQSNTPWATLEQSLGSVRGKFLNWESVILATELHSPCKAGPWTGLVSPPSHTPSRLPDSGAHPEKPDLGKFRSSEIWPLEFRAATDSTEPQEEQTREALGFSVTWSSSLPWDQEKTIYHLLALSGSVSFKTIWALKLSVGVGAVP